MNPVHLLWICPMCMVIGAMILAVVAASKDP